MDDPLFDENYPAKAGMPRKRASHTGDQMKPAASITLEMSDSSKELAQSRIDEAMSSEFRQGGHGVWLLMLLVHALCVVVLMPLCEGGGERAWGEDEGWRGGAWLACMQVVVMQPPPEQQAFTPRMHTHASLPPLPMQLPASTSPAAAARYSTGTTHA